VQDLLISRDAGDLRTEVWGTEEPPVLDRSHVRTVRVKEVAGRGRTARSGRARAAMRRPCGWRTFPVGASARGRCLIDLEAPAQAGGAVGERQATQEGRGTKAPLVKDFGQGGRAGKAKLEAIALHAVDVGIEAGEHRGVGGGGERHLREGVGEDHRLLREPGEGRPWFPADSRRARGGRRAPCPG